MVNLAESRLALASAVAISLLAGQAASAQSGVGFLEDFPDQARVAFAGTHASAGFVAAPSFEKQRTVVLFYATSDFHLTERTPRWVVRVARGEGKSWSVRWTDAASCPPVKDAVVWMTRLAPTAFRFPGNEMYSPPPRYVADGTVFTLWSTDSVQPDGAPVTIAMSSNAGAIAEWGEATLKTLEPCLQPTEPPPPVRARK